MRILERVFADNIKKEYYEHINCKEIDLYEKLKKENPDCLVIVENVSDFININQHFRKNWKITLIKMTGFW